MKKTNNELKDLRQFGAVLAIIFAVFGVVNLLKGRIGWYPWFFGLGFIALVLAFVSAKTLKPIYVIFTKVAHAIGWFNTRALLFIMYFIVITPIGIIMKIFGKDPLNRKIDKEAVSYWVDRAAVITDKERLEKQF